MSIQNLRERRAALAKETRNLLDQNPGASWTEAHGTQYDNNMAEIGRIEADIKRHEAVMALDAERQFDDIARNGRRDTNETDDASERSVVRAWARGGFDGMNNEQRAAFRNTMSTTTGSEGGFTVQSEVATSLLDALKAFGGVREVAEQFTTAQGNPLNYPNSDGTSEVGELVAENAAVTAADVSFGTSALNVYKFSSKVVTVPFELLQDSSIDVEALVRGRLVQRLGRIQNTLFTTGTGTAQPRGIVTAAGSGKVGPTGQTVTITYDDLIDLEHSVDPAYRKLGVAYMMSDAALKMVRKIKDTQGRPIFVPGYESGTPGGEPDTLLGRAININQDMAAPGANAKSILFGWFGAYKVRDAMGFTLFRFADSKYAEKGQVGFLAFQRAGGNYVDVGNSLKFYQHSAT